MGHSEPNFIGAATRQHYRELDRLEVSDGEFQSKCDYWRARIDVLDMGDLCCSDALVMAVKTGDIEMMGVVLASLVDSKCRNLAEVELYSKHYTDPETEAVKAMAALTEKRMGVPS